MAGLYYCIILGQSVGFVVGTYTTLGFEFCMVQMKDSDHALSTLQKLA